MIIHYLQPGEFDISASSCKITHNTGYRHHIANLFFIVFCFSFLKYTDQFPYYLFYQWLIKLKKWKKQIWTYRYRRRSRCTKVSSEKVVLSRLSAKWLKQIRKPNQSHLHYNEILCDYKTSIKVWLGYKLSSLNITFRWKILEEQLLTY
jgi:hypothetical protein